MVEVVAVEVGVACTLRTVDRVGPLDDDTEPQAATESAAHVTATIASRLLRITTVPLRIGPLLCPP